MGRVSGQNRMLMENRVKFSSDQSFLTKVALGHPDSFITTLAVRKINSEDHLYTVSLKSIDSYTRFRAYDKLENPEKILGSFYRNGEKKSFISKAIPHLKDESLLIKLAMKYWDEPELYRKIIDALKTKKSLKKLIDEAKSTMPSSKAYLVDYASERFDNLSNSIDFLLQDEEEN